MELDDIKSAWQALDARLARQDALQLELLRGQKQAQARRNLRPLLFGMALQAVLGIGLVLLGVGWSACTIAASALLASVDVGELRVPLQGGTDALMNYAGALAALASGPLLLLLGYGGLALVAALLTLPAATLIRKAALEVARMRSLSLPR